MPSSLSGVAVRSEPLLQFSTAVPGFTKESVVISAIVLVPDVVYFTSNTNSIELVLVDV